MLASIVALAAAPAIAPAATYAPANGHAWHGVSDTGSVADFDEFSNRSTPTRRCFRTSFTGGFR